MTTDRAAKQAAIAERYRVEYGLDPMDFDDWPEDLAEAYRQDMLAA